MNTMSPMARLLGGRTRRGRKPKGQISFIQQALKKLTSSAKKRGSIGKVVKKRRPVRRSIIKPKRRR